MMSWLSSAKKKYIDFAYLSLFICNVGVVHTYLKYGQRMYNVCTGNPWELQAQNSRNDGNSKTHHENASHITTSKRHT